MLLLLTQEDVTGVSEEDGRQDVWTDRPVSIPLSAKLTAEHSPELEEYEEPSLDPRGCLRPAGP